MQFTKAPMTLEEQADHLIYDHKMVGSRDEILSRLKSVGYYRLSGYWFPFLRSDDVFAPNTSMQNVWELYVFDRELRRVTFDAIERFEVFIRSCLAEALANRFGAFGYNDPNSMPNVIAATRNPSSSSDNPSFDKARNRLLSRFERSYKQASELFITQFKAQYGDCHDLPPYWMIVEIVDFGTTRQLYIASPNDIKAEIARQLGVHRKVLESWLNALRSVRNTCCHHSRLWNRTLGEMPAFPKGDPRWTAARKSRNRVFAILTILKYSLDIIAPTSNWEHRLRELLEECPGDNCAALGFPSDWEQEPLWKWKRGRKRFNEEREMGYYRWLDRADASLRPELAALASDEKALQNAFYRNLAFGTGGLRGIVGAGPNRMNVHTVARATQGLADYLNARFDAPSVAIARDSRRMGREFTETAAEVLAGNGIRALLYPRIEPTPALSWAVRDLGCSAGICITASHNPAPYNGYKVYGADGCQITMQAAREILAAINEVDMFDGPKRMPFTAAEKACLAQWIDDDTLDRYIDATAAQSLTNANKAQESLKVVYTPLHGAGLECVSRILDRIGVDVVVDPVQSVPDGEFSTCPYPNPEVREALERGLELCDEVHPDLLLATDPDADRVGIAVPHEGEYALLTGNEVGILLLDYICEMRKRRGEDLAGKIAITTIVSSAMADALAADCGFQLRRTLTGFKYIGEQIGFLEQGGQIGRFMFGFEESYGYLAGSQVRDKDAMVTVMLICEMARWHRAKGNDLTDAMQALYKRYGYYKNGLVTMEYPGAEGDVRMRQVMSDLRGNPPMSIAGLAVESTVDYASGACMPVLNPIAGDADQELPPADVLEFQLEGGNKLIIRPSGTEPKVKAYVFVVAKAEMEATMLLDNLESEVRGLLF